MFGVTTKPRIYNLGDYIPGNGGRVVYVTADKHHGLAVSLYMNYNSSTTWNSLISTYDNSTAANWVWRVVSENQFNTYLRNGWRGTATDYLPWGQGQWPAKPGSMTSMGDSILLRDSVDPTYCRRYVIGTDSFADYGKATTTANCRILVREF